MTVTQDELDSFHRFALDQLDNGSGETSMEELVTRWRAVCQRAEVNQRIQQGIDEMNAGLGQPLDEALEDIRQKLNIPAE